jgi:two-component system, OmpR family, sensor histidine kinase BaeS
MEALTTLTKPQWTLWGSVLILGACATAWLYGALPGINWPIATLSVSSGLMICWVSAGNKYRTNVVLPLVLACLLSVGAALTAKLANDVFIAGSVLFALGSAVVSAHANRNRMEGPGTWVVAAPYALVLVASETRGRLSETVDAVRAGRGVPVIRGVALATPVTLLLALLLSQADPTFATARDLIARAFQDLSLLPRGLFFLVVSACLLGIFGIASHTDPGHSPLPPVPATPRLVLGETERMIVLGSVAALFALFLTLQVSYLFGDPGGRAGSGVSYADAVHRGFVELNVASTICGALLFALRRYAASDQPSRWLKVLEWIVTIQAQVLLLSAFYRVNLYEGAYGFTTQRLYVQVYAAVAFIALILLMIELRGYPLFNRLVRRVLVVVALAFGGLIWGNSDAWIARANLLRYAHTGQIDVPYLTRSLGPDAVPELVRALPQLPSSLATPLEVCLRNRYPDHPDNVKDRWFEWSLRRVALNEALAHLRGNRTTVAADIGVEPRSC